MKQFPDIQVNLKVLKQLEEKTKLMNKFNELLAIKKDIELEMNELNKEIKKTINN